MHLFHFLVKITAPQCRPAVPSDISMLTRPEPNRKSFRFVKMQVEGGVAHPKSTRQATIYHRYVYNGDDTLSCFLNATPTQLSTSIPAFLPNRNYTHTLQYTLANTFQLSYLHIHCMQSRQIRAANGSTAELISGYLQKCFWRRKYGKVGQGNPSTE